mmetsp:Transcript_27026/g.49094  ORF Transcript_27026/g.49094 Transcript_27026/m.49094 type:complete len:239 (+) Transcript_27026:225-941(+)
MPPPVYPAIPPLNTSTKSIDCPPPGAATLALDTCAGWLPPVPPIWQTVVALTVALATHLPSRGSRQTRQPLHRAGGKSKALDRHRASQTSDFGRWPTQPQGDPRYRLSQTVAQNIRQHPLAPNAPPQQHASRLTTPYPHARITATRLSPWPRLTGAVRPATLHSAQSLPRPLLRFPTCHRWTHRPSQSTPGSRLRTHLQKALPNTQVNRFLHSMSVSQHSRVHAFLTPALLHGDIASI